MSEPIKPALTPEEWAKGKPTARGWDDGSVFLDWLDDEDEREDAEGTPRVERPHAIAAALLYGQPFGFTREDVTMLRGLVRLYESGDCGFHWDIEIAWANSLADRIESLLPPSR